MRWRSSSSRISARPSSTRRARRPKRKFAFAASLCNQPADTLIAVHRSFEDGEIREAFRTLRPSDGPKPLRAFAFLEVEGEDEPDEQVDLTALATGSTDAVRRSMNAQMSKTSGSPADIICSTATRAAGWW